MGCLFMHKWDGCKCIKCGQTRDRDHRPEDVPGKCLRRCAVCGQEWVKPHTYEDVADRCVKKCSVCGDEIPVPHSFVKGKCSRCGLERSSLGSAEFVEESEKYPGAENGAELARWLDNMIKRFKGSGNWELLEPACMEYSRSFAPIVEDMIKAEFYGKDYTEMTLEQMWGTEQVNVNLRSYFEKRFWNGEWGVKAAEGEFSGFAVATARPGLLHPGVIQGYQLNDWLKNIDSSIAEHPMGLPEIISDENHCTLLVKGIYSIVRPEVEQKLPELVYNLLTDAVKAAFS